MNLVYIAIGDNITMRLQAAFSIYSFLTNASGINSINIITDYPEYYNFLADKVMVITIDSKKVKEWKGDYNYLWRLKLKAIELVCDMYRGKPVVYLDGDTFLYNGFSDFKKSLLSGKAMMHENEGPISQARNKTARTMWSQLKGKTYEGIVVDEKKCMWNAGVIAIPNNNGEKSILTALKICDAMCRDGVKQGLIEQFSVSLALSETYDLEAADKYIAHYWSNKNEWSEEISKFLLANYFASKSNEEIIKEMSEFPYSTLPIKKKPKNTKERLNKLLEGIFPPKEVKYINKKA